MHREAKKLSDPELFDVLAATWVLACNDDNNFITYEGVIDRLSLSKGFDIRGLIASRRELFRLRMPPRRLERWKTEMRAGRRRPAWIAEIQEPALLEQTIDSLSPDDGFRSQFRTEDDAPKSSTETMEWGLDYLSRLRAASVEHQTKSATRFQMWLVFGAALLNIAATLYVGYVKTKEQANAPVTTQQSP